ncbi:DNA polymerase IV [Clostridia bacterium]|nr:DNA polymerase IV [Clostridia bacterium]
MLVTEPPKSKQKKVIFLVDMNAYFASVHQALDDTLKGKPVIVGGDAKARKGIVLAKSYECLDIGPVKTAMTLNEALLLVPEAIVVRPDHALYQKYAKSIRKILGEFTPLVEPNSIDEAFLDMTGTKRLFGSPYQAARLIQEKIDVELGLPCSVGIGETRIAAKMAADLKKPRGISTLWPHEIKEKMYPLAVGKLNGVGEKTARRLNQLAIYTVGDLAETNAEWLTGLLGKQAKELIEKAMGKGSDLVLPERYQQCKSIGNSLTFSMDLTTRKELEKELYKLCEKTALRLRKSKAVTGRISVSIKNTNFVINSHSRTLLNPTDLTEAIFQTALELLRELWQKEPVRLLGVSLEKLEKKEHRQISIFNDDKEDELQGILDELQERFGQNSIKRGRQYPE